MTGAALARLGNCCQNLSVLLTLEWATIRHQMTRLPTAPDKKWKTGRELVRLNLVFKTIYSSHSPHAYPTIPYIISVDNPLHRMRKFLDSKGWWSDADEESLKTAQKKAVLKAFQDAEKLLKPSLTGLFTDVYDELPWNLVSPHPPQIIKR